jgi:GH25 family lysozyme M1 (1,4-beta-N-acetylmuramidase)
MVALPPCVINLEPPPNPCPPGQYWNGSECVDDGDCPEGTYWDGHECVSKKPTPENSPGKGNLAYVTTLRGLACVIGAYGTDGTDGAPVWTNLSYDLENGAGLITQSGYTVSGTATAFLTDVHEGDRIVGSTTIDGYVRIVVDDNTLTMDSSASASTPTTFQLWKAKAPYWGSNAIRWFEIDPDSIDPINLDHFTAGYAMTDAGLFRVTGLPDAPVWTSCITDSGMATLLGFTPATMVWSFTTSMLLAGFVGVIGIANGNNHYFCWSLDYGVTWHTSSPTYSYVIGAGASGQASSKITASEHLADTFYIADFFSGCFPNYPSPPFGDIQATLAYVSSLVTPEIIPIQKNGSSDANQYFFPYYDLSGVIYANDAVAYWCKVFTPHLVNTGVAYPTLNAGTDIGDAAMPSGMDWYFTNMFDENYGVGIEGNDIWLTFNRGVAWTRKHDPTFGARQMLPKYLFCVPADEKIVLFVGEDVADNLGAVGMTIDSGTTLTDISKHGAADGINSVMALSLNDTNYSQILADRLFVSPTTAIGTMVDVSHYQGTMNWATTAAAGVTHAFIKATQGTTFTDGQYAANKAGALANGIKRGAYHFYVAGVDPVAQANHFYSVAGTGLELGYAIDVEENGSIQNNDTAANYKAFLDRMETLTGGKCVIYTRASYWNRFVGYQGWTSQYPLWVAHWGAAVPTMPTGWTSWVYWQYGGYGNGATYGAQSAFIDLDKVNG